MMDKTHYRNWFGSLFVGIVLFAMLAKSAKAAFPAVAAPLTLAWTGQSDPSVAGFALYYSAVGSSTTNRVDAGMLDTVTLFNLTAGVEYNFFAVSYTKEGLESLPSNVVAYQPTMVSPIKLSVLSDRAVHLLFRAVPGSTCRIERSATLNPAQWELIGKRTADANGSITFDDQPSARSDSQFYRAVQP
jgi:hypothetical protein